MAWPKGKKRGPRKPKPPVAGTTDAPLAADTIETYTGIPGKPVTVTITADPARYSPSAVPLKRQPAVTALEDAHERELATPRRKRVRKTGVTIDGRWFPCDTATLSGGCFLLEDGPIETRVPADGVRKIEFIGVSLTTDIAAMNRREAVRVMLDAQGRDRLVDPTQHVNVDPQRDDYNRRFSRERNRELEELQGELIGGES